MATAQEEFDELMRDKSRISTHPEDATDGRSFLNLSDNEDDDSPTTKREDDDADPRPSMSTYRSTIPNTRYQANTGPKGVIADAQHWRDSARTHRSAGRESSALAARTQTLSIENDAPTPPPLPTTQESDDDDLDEVDDEFMEKWRRSRLRDLQNGVWDNKSHANGQGKRLFGGLTTVDGDGYLEAVDSAGPHTVVVVYIYDDQSQVSITLERYLRQLAGRHQDTRFVRLHFEDAQMEPAGVPALIAYRGGEKFAGLVPMIDELPDDAEVSSITIENVMQRHQILH